VTSGQGSVQHTLNQLGRRGAMPYVKILEIVLKAVSAVIDAIMCVLKFIGYIGKMKPETE
jgi:hypothetical protein